MAACKLTANLHHVGISKDHTSYFPQNHRHATKKKKNDCIMRRPAVVSAATRLPRLPLAESFFVLIILAAYSWPTHSLTHRRTTENAPLGEAGRREGTVSRGVQQNLSSSFQGPRPPDHLKTERGVTFI